MTLAYFIKRLIYCALVVFGAATLIFFLPRMASERNPIVERMGQTAAAAGILSDESRKTLFRDAPDRKLTITDKTRNQSKTVSQRDIYSTRGAIASITLKIADPQQRELLERLLGTLLEDNLVYDEAATDALRNDAIAAVQPVMHTLGRSCLGGRGCVMIGQRRRGRESESGSGQQGQAECGHELPRDECVVYYPFDTPCATMQAG